MHGQEYKYVQFCNLNYYIPIFTVLSQNIHTNLEIMPKTYISVVILTLWRLSESTSLTSEKDNLPEIKCNRNFNLTFYSTSFIFLTKRLPINTKLFEI